VSEEPVARLAAAIESQARAYRSASPAPRGLPYLGLEHASGTGFHLLDGLAARGIFRKYELVLDLGAGLGGTSRWLAARLGCEVVGTAASPAEAAASDALTRRARLAQQVRVVAATAGALPFRTARFTHVWSHETLGRLGDPGAALAEAHRVLRRGGTLAIQDLSVVVPPGPALAGWRFAMAEERAEWLERAGFVEIEVRDRSAEAGERSAQLVAARDHLLARLRGDPRCVGQVEERETLRAALERRALSVIQIVARRP
jgi:SAM-dependent methyltransferase